MSPDQLLLQELNSWYTHPPGRYLLQTELLSLQGALARMFGYYIVQIGGPVHQIMTNSAINNYIVLNQAPQDQTITIESQLDQLPFLPNSIDVMVAFHSIELLTNPKQFLKEIYNSLIPNGHLIVVGFNPASLWKLASLWHKKTELPWRLNWNHPNQLRKLLTKIGFRLSDYKTCYFRPPSPKYNRLLFLEALGPIFWPYCGASYLVIAQKVITPLTPIKATFPWPRLGKTAKVLPNQLRIPYHDPN